MIGATPPTTKELTRSSDRISFIYVEHSVIHREDSAITATNSQGTVHIPAASLGALMLGPGTRITHHAMMLLGDCGATAVWVGEQGYATMLTVAPWLKPLVCFRPRQIRSVILASA